MTMTMTNTLTKIKKSKIHKADKIHTRNIFFVNVHKISYAFFEIISRTGVPPVIFNRDLRANETK